MADVVTTTRTFEATMYFVDGDTRAFQIKRPKADMTTADAQALQTWMQVNQPLIGDKTGAAFGRFQRAVIVNKATTDLDLS